MTCDAAQKYHNNPDPTTRATTHAALALYTYTERAFGTRFETKILLHWQNILDTPTCLVPAPLFHKRTKMTFAGLDPRFMLTGVTVTDRELGRGYFATVLEVVHKRQKYAGKKIHAPLPVEYENEEPIVDRFMEECRLLSQLHHPNIVQSVGVYFHQGERVPILVMELLHTDLHSCIIQFVRHGRLPEDITYSILYDVALGLHYLHSQSPPIMHRDITACNILLTSKMSAKICDFGSASRLATNCIYVGLTRIPGKLVYLPPEALFYDSRYETSIDMFSYGILMIFMFSGEFPAEVKPSTYTMIRKGNIYFRTEAERREKYLLAIGNDHPAMTLILQCITNDPQERPTATEITQQIKRICQYDGRCSIVHNNNTRLIINMASQLIGNGC